MIGVYHKKSWDRQTNRISISGAEWKGADPRFFLGGFSPVWVIVCCLRSPAWVNYLSQLLHLCGFSPVWMSMCVFKFSAQANDLSHPEQLSFFSTVFSDFWLGRMTCCKWYNRTSFLHCESRDASSDWKRDWMICHTGHKCAVDITLHGQLLHDIGCICSHTIFKQKVSHQCGWGCVSLNH